MSRAPVMSDSPEPLAPREPAAPLATIDPGWLFLIAGLALLAATMLIPAFDELDDVRWQRDRALAVEHHRIDRLDRHAEYLGALHREEPALLISLAASQLNQIPQGKTPVLETAIDATSSASVFGALEPPPALLPERRRVGSILERLATGERTRPWLLGAAGMCLLFGLLPRTRR
ncbi:MAG: hypothetical protein ACKVU4_03550 [Phycisphaerales bacterium]